MNEIKKFDFKGIRGFALRVLTINDSWTRYKTRQNERTVWNYQKKKWWGKNENCSPG